MDEEDLKKAALAKAYRENKGPAGSVVGMELGLESGRQFERRRRCQNCQWFDTEEQFDAHFHRCLQRDSKILRDRGATKLVVEAQAKKLRSVILEQRGQVGFCQKRIIRGDDQAADDFTSAGFLCDQWSGAFGMRFGPEEGPVDKLPDEVLDDIGEANPPRPGETADDGTELVEVEVVEPLVKP